MSGVIQKETSVAAGATTDIFADSAFLYPQRRAVVSLGVLASATGAFITVYSGGRLILEESAPKIGTVMPNTDEDFFYNFVAEAGERLTLSFRNPTGGALTCRAVAQIQDL